MPALIVVALVLGVIMLARRGSLNVQPAASLRTSAAGRLAIRRHEGTEYTAYQDVAGKWTIGTGHLVTAVEYAALVGTPRLVAGKSRGSVTLTAVQELALFDADLSDAEGAVRRYVVVPITQGMFDALTSWVFNFGGGALSGSTLLKKINASDWLGAAAEFLRWNKATDPATGQKMEVAGLTTRRQKEQQMFLQGVA